MNHQSSEKKEVQNRDEPTLLDWMRHHKTHNTLDKILDHTLDTYNILLGDTLHAASVEASGNEIITHLGSLT